MGCFEDFLIDSYAVTNGQYRPCFDDNVCNRPSNNMFASASNDNLPVTNVTWDIAHSYCMWRGERLPTEAEWRHAAAYLDLSPGNRQWNVLGNPMWEWVNTMSQEENQPTVSSLSNNTSMRIMSFASDGAVVTSQVPANMTQGIVIGFRCVKDL